MSLDKMEIMVVDDEPKQRRGLAAMVRSLRPDYRICEAKNGKEALELATNRPIDVVFTDIQMPVMNGLEFAEALSGCGRKEPKVIFVSVYHEFGYAQKAIRLGAKDYLVKPVSPEALEDVIATLEGELQQERRVQDEKQHLVQEVAHMKPLYVEQLIYRWMKGELKPQELAEVKSVYTLKGPGTIMVLQTWSRSQRDSEQEWSSILRQTVSRTLSGHADIVLISPKLESDKVYAVLQWKQGREGVSCLTRLRTAVMKLEEVYGLTVSAGIGQGTEQIEAEISTCFQSANKALEYLYYFPKGYWLYFGELHSLQSSAPSFQAVLKGMEKLDEAGAVVDSEETVQTYAELLERLSSAYPSPFRFKSSVIQLLHGYLKRVEAVLEEKLYAELIERIDREVLETRSLQETCSLSAALLKEIAHYMKKDKNSRSEFIMQKCKEFLDENLHEDLGLEMVAQRFFYNSSYFSILFKSHFGLSFTDYIAKIRMQKARGLLLQTDLKVAEIAKQVGYKECKYFNKVFKKMFLYSPEEFRRMFATTR